MDAFASILSAEMAKKKSTSKPSDSKATTTATGGSSSKFIRRGDLEKARQEQYLADQARLEAERAERALKKRKAEEEAAAERERQLEKRQRLREEKEKLKRQKEEEEEAERRKKLKEQNGGVGGDDDGEDGKPSEVEQMDEETAVQKLREMKEPARLFGESHAQRLKRIHRLIHGSNPGTPKRTPSPPPLSGGELIIDPANVSKEPAYVRRQLLGWFQLLISEWQIALANRDEEVRESYQGKQATTAMEQAIENLQPLFRHLRKGDLNEEVFGKIVELVVEAQRRRYVRANDVYLRLSIGNAAWPIGVTMVGIHERSAREKLHEKGKSAHIMSDEATRKYLQSIKRCLNFAQTRWPPEDPMQIMG
ncbi:hypothetical protein ABW19_dt0207737 [Dactylella cylindrospora]|nr:hypothetical protein ABW19_dt0207737 [Dactylella cylindrospora]